MTHILHANGLFPTAIEAAGRTQDNEEVDALCNKLNRGDCLGTADRKLLIGLVTTHKTALNLWRPTAQAQRTMDACDAIIKLAV